MKRSFFGKYCLYKLYGFRGIAVAAAVLNIVAVVLPAVFLYNAVNDANTLGYVWLEDMPLFVPFIAIAVMAVMLVITPAMSFKYYNNRAAMDTLGCLPLTYKERFWGDFLSGLAANMVSFIPFSAIGAVIIAIMQNTAVKQIQASLWAEYEQEYILPEIKDDFLKAYLGFVILLLLVYIGTYVVSTFVTSCCGRVGSSIFYSVMVLIIPAGIVSTFGTCVLNGAVGVVTEEEIGNVLMAIAPAGTLFGTWLRFSYDGLPALMFIVDTPSYIALALLVAAVFLVWAYFLGKHRKAERVDRDFVYNGAYHVIAISLSAAIIGFYFSLAPASAEAFGTGAMQRIITSIAVGLVIYAVMELVHTRNVRTLPKTLLRYAALYAACFGFLFLADKTEGFGIAVYVPDKQFVSEVEIEGTLFYNNMGIGGKYVYRSDAAIETIVNENEKLLQNRESLKTGNMVDITYVMKNGTEVRRQYSPNGGEGRALIETFCAEVKKNEPSTNALGFVGEPRYDEIIRVVCDLKVDEGYRDVFVKPEAYEELFEALRYDLLNNFEQYENHLGHMTISYTLNGVQREADYQLETTFGKTLAVIENNALDEAPEIENEEFYYYISYFPGYDAEAPIISSFMCRFPNTDGRAAAKAVMALIAKESDVPEEERSEKWKIMSGSQFSVFCVRKTDENAMLKAMTELALEEFKSE